MTGARAATLPSLSVPVRCGDDDHTLDWAAGELTTTDHPDADRERTLSALGADPSPCIEIVDRWSRHRADLDVLVLASRGPADPVTVGESYAGHARVGHSHVGSSSSAYASTLSVARFAPLQQPRRRGRGGKQGWTSYSPIGSGAVPGVAGDHEDEVIALLGLGGLADRLVATVAATWADRIDSNDASVAVALPALHAALYGRAVAAVHSWLGDASAVVELSMCDPGQAPALTREADVVRLALPFSWLSDVWARGLATLLGRFCLSATAVAPDRWTLQAVDSGFGPARSITVDAG
ncbi:MAG: hypothetical protein ACRDWT_14420 [Jatrophihabitantaceae bacterium]